MRVPSGVGRGKGRGLFRSRVGLDLAAECRELAEFGLGTVQGGKRPAPTEHAGIRSCLGQVPKPVGHAVPTPLVRIVR